jgi:hypothetical protein
VLHFRFDLIDSIDGKSRLFLNFGRRIFRDDPFFSQCLGHCELDIKPALIFILIFPNPAHLGARVACDHDSSL